MAKEQEEPPEYLEQVAKALGEPVFLEPNPQTLKIKTQLLVMSVLSIIIVYFQLKIGEGSSIFGLKVDNLNDDVVHTVLFGIILYLLGSFFWFSVDGFGEWRLRITGSKVAFQTVSIYADGHSDYPKDPRQSTLYNWWKEQAPKIGNIAHQAEKANEKTTSLVRTIELHTKGLSEVKVQQSEDVIGQGISAVAAIDDLNKNLAKLKEILQDKRISVSLKRFDDWFYYFRKSQNIRWFILDCSLPLILGITALIFLRGCS